MDFTSKFVRVSPSKLGYEKLRHLETQIKYTMALAFRSHGSGTSDTSTSIFKFHAARPAEEQPLIPPHSLFASLNNDKVEVDTGLPQTAECAIHLELLETFLILKQKVDTSNVLDRALGIRPDPKKKTFQARRDLKWTIYTWATAAPFLKWWSELGEILKNGQFEQDNTNQWDITDAVLPPLGE